MSKYTLLVNKETKSRSVRINKTGEVVLESADSKKYLDLRRKAMASLRRSQKEDLMGSFGLTKAIGSVSGKVYWE